MRQQYEDAFLYFLLVSIVNLTYNDKYIYIYFFLEIKISRVSNTIFLIHQFQFWTNVPLKTILINEI